MNDNFRESEELKEFLELAGINNHEVIDGITLSYTEQAVYNYSDEPAGTFEGRIENMPANAETYISPLSFRITENQELKLNSFGLAGLKASASKNVNLIKVDNKHYVRFIYRTSVEKQEPIMSDKLLPIESISGEYILVEPFIF